jgi:ABC-2 type transport system ATP-binding protein
MIELREVTKRYRSLTAVRRLSLHVRRGEVFGFLGPNGAGKTTTIRMIAGLMRPSEGSVLVGGIDVAADPIRAKSLMGFIPDRPFLYEKLTGEEFLRFIGGLYRIEGLRLDKRMDELFELFGLGDFRGELIEGYSHGMRQRLVMGAAFLHHPDVVVVDEPMVGLDPQGARLVKSIFREYCSRGKTVFMSTHTLGVAEEVCDRIGIIHKGELIALGTREELQRQAKGEADRLESIFLQLTGGEEMIRVVECLRS